MVKIYVSVVNGQKPIHRIKDANNKDFTNRGEAKKFLSYLQQTGARIDGFVLPVIDSKIVHPEFV